MNDNIKKSKKSRKKTEKRSRKKSSKTKCILGINMKNCISHVICIKIEPTRPDPTQPNPTRPDLTAKKKSKQIEKKNISPKKENHIWNQRENCIIDVNFIKIWIHMWNAKDPTLISASSSASANINILISASAIYENIISASASPIIIRPITKCINSAASEWVKLCIVGTPQ